MNNIIYILEGPDCAGKTTLAHALAEAFNYPIFHLSVLENKEEHWKQFDTITDIIQKGEIRLKGDKHYTGAIIDRYCLSALAYENVFGNTGAKESESVNKALNTLLWEDQRLNATIHLIFCLPDNEEEWMDFFIKTSKTREEMFAKEGTAEKLISLHNEFYNFRAMFQERNFTTNRLLVSTFDLFAHMGRKKDRVFDFSTIQPSDFKELFLEH